LVDEDVRHTHFEGDDLFDVFVILEVELVVALHFYDRLLINIKVFTTWCRLVSDSMIEGTFPFLF
jgi:hypothetical protein